MRWNWQQEDWPRFTYQAAAIDAFEAGFLQGSGVVIGALRHLDHPDQEQLKVDLISTEALKTSEIEGELLNRVSLQSSIRRHFGLQTEAHRAKPAEDGIAEMMVNLYRTFEAPLTHESLFDWHRMLTNGRRDLTDIGRYREHGDPTQVVSGPVHRPKVHFEAPASRRIAKEMEAFIKWFNGNMELPALTRAGMAHLYFISIHPFEDGNGRIGRAISEKAIAQSIGQPSLTALAYQIEKHRNAYYDALEAANKHNEITGWLIYFAEVIMAAQKTTGQRIEFLIDKTKLCARLRGKVNARQEKTLQRMFRQGPEGFNGGLSAENYLAITGTSRATTTRDLTELVTLGALHKTGQLKSTRYWLNLPSLANSAPR